MSCVYSLWELRYNAVNLKNFSATHRKANFKTKISIRRFSDHTGKEEPWFLVGVISRGAKPQSWPLPFSNRIRLSMAFSIASFVECRIQFFRLGNGTLETHPATPTLR
jgi:hypothetical protein